MSISCSANNSLRAIDVGLASPAGARAAGGPRRARVRATRQRAPGVGRRGRGNRKGVRESRAAARRCAGDQARAPRCGAIAGNHSFRDVRGSELGQSSLLIRRARAGGRPRWPPRGPRGIRPRAQRAARGIERVPDRTRRGRTGGCAERRRLGGTGAGFPLRGCVERDSGVLTGKRPRDDRSNGRVPRRARVRPIGICSVGGIATTRAAQYRNCASVLLGRIHDEWRSVRPTGRVVPIEVAGQP